MGTSKRWQDEDFVKEIKGWMFGIKYNPKSSVEASLEFSKWQMRNEKYLSCRFEENNLEIHIVYSIIHACPMLLLRDINDPHKIPNLLPTSSFIGGFEYHPHLPDQVFFAIHGCETRSWMSFLDSNDVKLAPGILLLSWYSVIANQALKLSLSPEVFVQAKSLLETYNGGEVI